jgi:hypothetical protein
MNEGLKAGRDVATTGAKETAMADAKTLTPAQRAYEQKRAAKAGKSLESWLDAKQKRAAAEVKPAAPPPKKPPGLISRLLDRAHKPL